MSSWMMDWERGLINTRGNPAKYRTDCKLGRHAILVTMPAAWLTNPMGLSCEPCIRASGVQAHLDALEAAMRPAPKIPTQTRPSAKDPANWKHGKFHTYSVHGCRCDPCTAANTERSVKRRAQLRAAKERRALEVAA